MVSEVMSGNEWLEATMKRFRERIEEAEKTIEECRSKRASLGRLRSLLEVQNEHGNYARGYFEEELKELKEDLGKLDNMAQEAESSLNRLVPKLQALEEINERMNRS